MGRDGRTSLLIRNLPVDVRRDECISPVHLNLLFPLVCLIKSAFSIAQRMVHGCTSLDELVPPTALLPRLEEVRDMFERYGPLRDIYLPRDYHTGQVAPLFVHSPFVEPQTGPGKKIWSKTCRAHDEAPALHPARPCPRPQDRQQHVKAEHKAENGG
jgi:hypothetical protein